MRDAIAEKSRLKDDAVMDGTLALELELELAPLDGAELPPHAVRARAAPATSAIAAAFFLDPCNIATSLMVAANLGAAQAGRVVLPLWMTHLDRH